MTVHLATHDGVFHADDVVAYVTLVNAFHERATLTRTRDPEVLAGKDILFDVGDVYDHARGRYDHHQKDKPKRADGTLFSAAGLVWQHHGQAALTFMLSELSPTPDEIEAIWARIDHDVLVYIDKVDNGIGTPPERTDLVLLIDALNPTWEETSVQGTLLPFFKAADLAGSFLERLARQILSEVRAAYLVATEAARQDHPHVLVLDRALPWQDGVFSHGLDHLWYVVHPDTEGSTWMVMAVPPEKSSFDQRKPLPEAWAGLRGDAFAKVSGVADGIFCHTARFVCGAHSLKGAMALADAACRA